MESLWQTMMEQERASPSVAMLHDRIEGNLKLIGLTGGIASGKSTVASLLRDAGMPVIDADRIAREVVEPGRPAHEAVVREFGNTILNDDGTIRRDRLAAIVFSDPEKRGRLEALTHPYIFRAIADEVRRLHRELHPKFVVIDAALLFESRLNLSMDQVILVKASPEIQLRRLMDRDGFSETEAKQRIDSQMAIEEKERLSDFVIENEGSLEELHREVSGVLGQLAYLRSE